MLGSKLTGWLVLTILFLGIDSQLPGQDSSATPIKPTQNPVIEPPVLGPPTPLSPPTVVPPNLDPNPPRPKGPATPPVPKGELQPPTQIPLPNAKKRQLFIVQRSAIPFQFNIVKQPNDEEVITFTGGIKFLAIFTEDVNLTLDIEADQLVIWTKGSAQDLIGAMREPSGSETDNSREIELYMSGNVIIRFGSDPQQPDPKQKQIQDGTLRAERAYYNVSKNQALVLNGNLEFSPPELGVPVRIKADEIQQLSLNEFKTLNTSLNGSQLPSDPGLELTVAEATIFQQKKVRRTLFGIPFLNRQTGDEIQINETTFEGKNSRVKVGGVPIFYVPFISGNVNDPLGPIQSIGFRQDRVFGTQLYTTFDVLELIGVTKLDNERWNLYADYLSRRGPGIGTEYDIYGTKFLGIESRYSTNLRLYGIYDNETDILGGPRENNFTPADFRGRVFFRHQQEIDRYTIQSQLSYLSDPNFYEQYYKYEFDYGPNQETFIHTKYQEGNYAGTLLLQPNFNRYWVTETQWLPKVSGYAQGLSFLDRFTYNAWGNVGYANLRPSEEPPFATQPTEQRIDTGRIDLMQELTAPFNLGPLRVAPYGTLNLAAYTDDLQGDSRGRYVVGGGSRATLPLSKLYESVESDLFNLHGLYHKITFGSNYYTAYSNTPYFLLPQLDRLNDDALDLTVREITPFQTTYVSFPAGSLLQTSPIFNPQLYAIRRLVDTRTDTLDTIQVVQADIRQRFQTKRGYPGMERTVDWLTLDLSASFFPADQRDNFGEPISFIEYDSTWYVGDQTGITSSGWFDPFDSGTRYWNIGGFLTRPDRTRFYLGYRQTDPLNSKAITGALSYVFSPKYSITASTIYDFGTSIAQSTSLVFTRTGTDLSISVGLTYNSILNNFGFTFEVVPNLLAARGGGRGLLGGLSGASNPYGARR